MLPARYRRFAGFNSAPLRREEPKGAALCLAFFFFFACAGRLCAVFVLFASRSPLFVRGESRDGDGEDDDDERRTTTETETEETKSDFHLFCVHLQCCCCCC